MAGGTSRPQGKSGENIIHVGIVRFRVNGEGNLRLSLHSLQNTRSVTHPNPLVMATNTDVEPTKLFNFMNQRIALQITTTDIDEYFRINRIVIFDKPVFTDYPRS